jgi:hypothetical protein
MNQLLRAMKHLEICIANFSILLPLLLLLGCPRDGQYQFSKIPKVEECRMLSASIFCIDKRLSNSKIDGIIQYIDAQNSLSATQKQELIFYFNSNRDEIIKSKEFEISFEYIGFFRGYFLTTPMDEKILKDFMDERLLLLDKYIDQFGRFK